MRGSIFALTMVAGFVAGAANADLTPWKDYSLSESVWAVTTVKVKSNMQDAYLEGLKKTWVTTNEVAKQLGQIEDYKILVSDLPESGDFNLLLVVKFKNNEMLAPNQARYEAFMAKFGEQRNKETTQMAQRDYPAMRELTGDYNLREVTMK
jgi:hypothetical protein